MRMGWVPTGAGEEGQWVTPVLCSCPSIPLFLSQPSLVALLTVGKVGPLGAGDCNCDGGLHTVVGPANVLACVSWRRLEDVEAGAADLGSMGRGVKRASQRPADAPLATLSPFL